MNKKYIPIILVGVGALIVSFVVWKKRQVILHAKKYLGILEKGDNVGWNDPKFEEKLKNVGWKPGYQWCVYFVKAMWNDVYPFLKKKTHNGQILLDYISGLSQLTYSNFIKLSKETTIFKVSAIPRPGDIVVWQNFKNGVGQTTGHVGLVTKVKGDEFSTIEGNTSELGKSEETVSRKNHSLGEMAPKNNGLKLKGFIHYKNV
jgi:hypothetical protein